MASPYTYSIKGLDIPHVCLAKISRLEPSKLEPGSCQYVNTLLLKG